MLEKNIKISVLEKMMGLNEKIEPVVPHNSVTNMYQKLGITEPPAAQQRTSTAWPPPTMPVENSFRNLKSPVTKCPHCENMAKNFLYLESLIRTNYNAKYQCKLCFSSLKYLQYVNKSIMQVFGNFDSIVEAAKAFTTPHKRSFKLHKEKLPHTIGVVHTRTKSIHSSHSNTGRTIGKALGSKYRLPKKRSRGTKFTAKRAGKKFASSFSLRSSKHSRSRSRNSMKKGSKQKTTTTSRHTIESSIDKVDKVAHHKTKKSKKSRLSKATNMLSGLNQKIKLTIARKQRGKAQASKVEAKAAAAARSKA